MAFVTLSISAVSLLWAQPDAFATRSVTSVQKPARILTGQSTLGPALWAKRYNGRANRYDAAKAMVLSPDGSTLYVTGSSTGSTSIDYATVAYDASTGTQLWVTRYDGSGYGDDSATALGVSPDGSRLFVTGASPGSNSADEYATVSYDAVTGTQLWVARYEGPANSGYGADFATDLGVSPDGSMVFVTGWSVGSTSSDYATVAYDPSTGAELWARRYNGPENGGDYATALRVSADGSRVFVTGYSAGSTSGDDYATVAYDGPTGIRLWAKRYNGRASRDDSANALGLSPDGSMVFVTGFSTGANSSYDDATVAYDATTGAQLWVTRYNGPANRIDEAGALGVSPDGSTVFVTGTSYGSATSDDYATVAYDATTGAQLWVTRYDGPANGVDQAAALGVSPDGSIVFVTGTSSGATSDYATLAYDASNGAKLWARRFDGPGNGDDTALALEVSPDGSRVFVTGRSVGSTSNYDYATRAYAAV